MTIIESVSEVSNHSPMVDVEGDEACPVLQCIRSIDRKYHLNKIKNKMGDVDVVTLCHSGTTCFLIHEQGYRKIKSTHPAAYLNSTECVKVKSVNDTEVKMRGR